MFDSNVEVSIAASSDAVLSGPVANQVLTYDDTIHKWKNADAQNMSDASTLSKGVVQLAGDLAGTATSPALAAIGSAVSATGSATAVPVVSIDAKGRVTALSSVANLSANTLGTPNNPVTDASAARPTGLTRVYWLCATQPTNWQNGDEWINNA